MSDTDHFDEDEVLRRMLNTPHEKHKPLREKSKPAEKPEAAGS